MYAIWVSPPVKAISLYCSTSHSQLCMLTCVCLSCAREFYSPCLPVNQLSCTTVFVITLGAPAFWTWPAPELKLLNFFLWEHLDFSDYEHNRGFQRGSAQHTVFSALHQTDREACNCWRTVRLLASSSGTAGWSTWDYNTATRHKDWQSQQLEENSGQWGD